MSCLRLRNPQRALLVDRQIDARRNNIDALALDFHPIGRQRDPHRGMARKQIHHHAVVAGVQVLNDDEGHAVDRRQRVQKLPASIEASGRGADCHDRKLRGLAGGEWLRYPTGSFALDDMMEASGHSESFLEERRSNGASDKSLAIFARNCDRFQRTAHSRANARKREVMSSFRIFPGEEASYIVVPASPQRISCDDGRLGDHDRVNAHGFRY